MPAKKGFELQDTDLDLLHAVYELRLATTDQLAALSGRSVRALWGRLLKLKDRRYLASAIRFRQKQIYAIGSEGGRVLIEHGYTPQALSDRRLRPRELTDIGIRHSLFVANIHTKILLLTRSGQISLAHWQEGSALWDSVVPSRDDPSIPIRPDAYFILNHAARLEGRNRFHIFLEADRSTMSHQRMTTKIAGYLAYYEQARYAEKYPDMPTFLVATVTETPRRAEALRKDLHPLIPRAAQRQAYLFVPYEDLSLASLLPRMLPCAIVPSDWLRIQ